MPTATPTLWIVHVAFPVFAGGLIYVVFRERTLVVFHWVDALGLRSAIEALRDSVPLRPPDLARYSLPDGLWVYATTSWMLLTWRGARRSLANPWLHSGSALGIGGEFGQSVGLLPGTFDPRDVLLSALAAILAFGFLWRRRHGIS